MIRVICDRCHTEFADGDVNYAIARPYLQPYGRNTIAAVARVQGETKELSDLCQLCRSEFQQWWGEYNGGSRL